MKSKSVLISELIQFCYQGLNTDTAVLQANYQQIFMSWFKEKILKQILKI